MKDKLEKNENFMKDSERDLKEKEHYWQKHESHLQ